MWSSITSPIQQGQVNRTQAFMKCSAFIHMKTWRWPLVNYKFKDTHLNISDWFPLGTDSHKKQERNISPFLLGYFIYRKPFISLVNYES